MKYLYLILSFLFLILGNPFSVDGQSKGKTYIVIAKSKIPPQLERDVKRMNGVLLETIPEIGVALVGSGDPDFEDKASRIAGVHAVILNAKFQYKNPDLNKFNLKQDEVGNPPNSGSDDFFFDLQWGHTAIEAPAAWSLGAKGNGVRVAVIDDGIDRNHPDLAPNLNVDLSRSFVPHEPEFDYIGDDVFSHGAHVAGIIAAAQNDYGVIGVAPEAELVMLKVFDKDGIGDSFRTMQAMVYAANINADVINMSLGLTLPRNGKFVDEEGNIINLAKFVQEFINAYKRASSYAYKNGAILIASAGNNALNSNESRSVVHLPSDLPHVMSISATGPLGWAVNPNTNLNEPAFYTNYGLNSIDLAAPGGNVDFDLLDAGSLCNVGGWVAPCYVFDLVFSTGSQGSWYWSAGTSMAAPYVSGVAALVIGASEKDLTPAQVESILRKSAEDIGKPGKDPYFGHGMVNAYNAVQMVMPTETVAKGKGKNKLNIAENLAAVYPNPFSQQTTINYFIPTDSKVSLQIYNLQGQLVQTLIDGFKPAGTYSSEWNGTSSTGGAVLPGTYIYRLKAGDYQEANKLILIK